MIINHNIGAMNAYKNLTTTNSAVQKSMEKLSSGYRINRAGDDAAGLAISEKMRSQVKGLNMAAKNSQDGISLIQTAEGALNETHSILQRMRELAIQSANDTNENEDREQMNLEITELVSELTRIGDQTEFNKKKVVNGDLNAGITFHIGANAGQNITLSVGDMRATALALNGLSVSTQSSSDSAISVIDDAIKSVSSQRSKLGATQNRLEHTINNLRASSENLQAAESRIRDVDMAQEMVEFSKNQIISQSGTSMLAQANTQPQGILQLLQ